MWFTHTMPARSLPHHAERAEDVARPHRAREPVGRGVGDPHRLGLAVERDDRDHRAEDLLLGDRHARIDAGRRWWARGRRRARAPRRAPAAQHQPRALAPALLDVAHHALAMRGGDQRPHARGAIERVAEPDGARLGDHRLEEAVVDRSLDQDARARPSTPRPGSRTRRTARPRPPVSQPASAKKMLGDLPPSSERDAL